MNTHVKVMNRHVTMLMGVALTAALCFPVYSNRASAVSGGQDEKCTGKVGDLNCASEYPGETCLDSSQWEEAAESYRYYVKDGTGDVNTCSDKNPGSQACEGKGPDASDYCKKD